MKMKTTDWALIALLVVQAANENVSGGEHLIATLIVIAIWEFRND